MSDKTRAEKDPLGTLEVPADALYGVQTLRAVQNFPISGMRPLPAFVEATVRIKRAAALTHEETGRLDAKLADAIVKAADEILSGKHREHFVVDVYQAGAGTSHNMNVNEVLANRANEILGGKRGTYTPVHPNDHVNMGQSTNDVIPTAIRLACLTELPGFQKAIDGLARAFEKKGRNSTCPEVRTNISDAMPIGSGRSSKRMAVRCAEAKRVVEPPTTFAIWGSGQRCRNRRNVERSTEADGKHLRESTKVECGKGRTAPLMQAWRRRGFSAQSRFLRRYQHDRQRSATVASGPRTGFDEIRLPAVQPARPLCRQVKPSIPEMVNQSVSRFRQRRCVSVAAEHGQLELT